MRSHPTSWDDMSNYVVHFTKGGDLGDDYDTIMSIYSSGVLKAQSSFGIGRSRAPEGADQSAVCFSEIPPGEWGRLVARRKTKYGLAFTKQFVVDRGGGPIWYAWKGTPQAYSLDDMMNRAATDETAPIWAITPMIDSPGDTYQFDWEREWRHCGDLRFSPSDVSFLLIPENIHTSAWGFFEDAQREHLGPAYFCPYIDPAWDRRRILNELASKASP